MKTQTETHKTVREIKSLRTEAAGKKAADKGAVAAAGSSTDA